jgi:hypothetical protein
MTGRLRDAATGQFAPMPRVTAGLSDYAIERDDAGRLPAYAWPGGYPMYYVTRDGLTICPQCANATDRATDDPPVAGDVYWEGPSMTCDDQGETIESAYGDPDAPDDTTADDGTAE